jgi:large subunit ribosomal protein L30
MTAKPASPAKPSPKAKASPAAKAAPKTGRVLSITLKRSPIGTPQTHRLVLRGLGLRRISQIVERPDTQQVQGMIHKVGYLLEVKTL